MKIATLMSNLILLTILGSTIASGQEKQRVPPKQPHLFHCWTDASGETHIKEIILGNNKRAPIPGATMNFSGTPIGNGVPAFHRVGQRQFAITVFGEVEVEERAHSPQQHQPAVARGFSGARGRVGRRGPGRPRRLGVSAMSAAPIASGVGAHEGEPPLSPDAFLARLRGEKAIALRHARVASRYARNGSRLLLAASRLLR